MEHEECEPAFRHVDAARLPTYAAGGLRRGSSRARPTARGRPFPVHSPLFYVHWTLAAGARADLEARYPERAAYVAAGSVDVDGRTFDAGQMLVFAPGETIVFEAVSPAIVMLLGGEPIGERFIEWNFVSSSRARIDRPRRLARGADEAARPRRRGVRSAASRSA